MAFNTFPTSSPWPPLDLANDLNDNFSKTVEVSLSTNPVDGAVLVYDASADIWTDGQETVTLDDLTNVVLATVPTDGDLLTYDASSDTWINVTYSLEDINNVSISTSPTDGSMLVYNASSDSWEDSTTVTITGGTIDGATIGGTTPATGSFTSLSATDPDASLLPVGSEILWPSAQISSIPTGWGDTSLRLLSGASERAILSNSAINYLVSTFSPKLVTDFTEEFYVAEAQLSDFDSVLTHSATSLLTMTDSDGLIKWAPHNLITYSEDFTDASWLKTNTDTLAVDATGPDGETSAVTLVDSGSGGTGNVYVQNTNLTGLTTDTYHTISVFAKADQSSFLAIRIGAITSPSAGNVWFNLSSGTVGTEDTGYTGSIEDFGNGWYRCSSRFFLGGGDTDVYTYFYAAEQDDSTVVDLDGTSSILIYGAHFYLSGLGGMADVPTDARAFSGANTYVPTTSSAVYLPRRGHHRYDGSSYVNKGLLLESEARTNLITYSEDFTDASWTSFNSSVSGDVVASPSGEQTGSALTETSSSGVHTISTTLAATSGGWVGSVFIKDKGDGRYIQLRPFGVGSGVAYATFDPSDGSVFESGGSGLEQTTSENMGDGWFRVSIYSSSDLVDSGDGLEIVLSDGTSGERPNYVGDGSSGVYIYGAQLEEGSTPSSYIPTSGSTVTRAAETLTIAAANLPYSSTAMSIAMEGEVTYADEDIALNVQFWNWTDTALDRMRVYLNTSSTKTGEVVFFQEASNVAEFVVSDSDAYSPGVNVPFNIASRHGSTFLNGAVDGTALTEDTTPTALPDLSATDLDLGQDFMGTISSFRMWDVDLGDAGIEEASS